VKPSGLKARPYLSNIAFLNILSLILPPGQVNCACARWTIPINVKSNVVVLGYMQWFAEPYQESISTRLGLTSLI